MDGFLNTPLDYAVAFEKYLDLTMKLERIGLGFFSVEGRCLYANDAFDNLFGEMVGFQAKGKSLEDLQNTQLAEEGREIFRRVCETEKAETRRRIVEGQCVESVISPWKASNYDGPTRHVVTISRECSPTESVTHTNEVLLSKVNTWGQLARMTPRQFQVLALLRQGMTHEEIANALSIAPNTVETHRDQLVNRLRVKSTLEAIRLADRAGLTLENAPTSLPRDRSSDTPNDT